MYRGQPIWHEERENHGVGCQEGRHEARETGSCPAREVGHSGLGARHFGRVPGEGIAAVIRLDRGTLELKKEGETRTITLAPFGEQGLVEVEIFNRELDRILGFRLGIESD